MEPETVEITYLNVTRLSRKLELPGPSSCSVFGRHHDFVHSMYVVCSGRVS